MTEMQRRLIQSAEDDVDKALHFVTEAIRKLKEAGGISHLPSPLDDVYLDLNGCAGPLDGILKTGKLSVTTGRDCP